MHRHERTGLVTAVAGHVHTVTSLVVDHDVLTGEGIGRAEHEGVTLTRSGAHRHTCDGSIARVVMAGRSEVLDVGRATRVVPVALRRALVLRDGGCVFPGCDQPAHRCDVHHFTHWARGGTTDLDNTGLVCEHHHRAVHEGGFTMSRRAPDGTITVVRPDGTPVLSDSDPAVEPEPN